MRFKQFWLNKERYSIAVVLRAWKLGLHNKPKAAVHKLTGPKQKKREEEDEEVEKKKKKKKKKRRID